MNSNILVLSIPRSGSTWVSEIISQAGGLRLIHEPDNEKIRLIARAAKNKTHRFYSEEEFKSSKINDLWSTILLENYDRSYITEYLDNFLNKKKSNVIKENRLYTKNKIPFGKYLMKKSTSRLVVKSVHGVFALKSILSIGDFKVIIPIRHPANVFASYKRLNLNDAGRIFEKENYLNSYIPKKEFSKISESSDLSRIISQIAYQYKYIFDVKELFKDRVLIVEHEKICEDPNFWFEKIFDFCDIQFSEKVKIAIDQRNQSGSGFATNRLMSELKNKYKQDLCESEIDEIRNLYQKIEKNYKW